MTNSALLQFSKDQVQILEKSPLSISQSTQEIISLLGFVNDCESYNFAISRINQIQEQELSTIVPAIFYLIWSTPIFKVQVELIDRILSNSPRSFHALLFDYICSNFNSISTDRKDKFFYFLKKVFSTMSLSYILGIENVEVLGFLLLKIEKSMFNDWSDALFLEFVANCKPFILENIQNIKIDEKAVRLCLKEVTNPKNREALYKLFK